MASRRSNTACHKVRQAPAKGNDIKVLKERVGDQWLDLLSTLAPELDEACDEFPEHVPCPIHGGNDGFRLFNDAEVTGGGVCNTCGSFSDGIALLQAVKDWSFTQTLKKIESWLDNGDDMWNEEEEEAAPANRIPAKRRQESPEVNQKSVDYIKDIQERAEAGHERIYAYYRSRGLSQEPSENLGYVAEEKYYESEVGSLTLPAMLAIFQDLDGQPVAVFRTYLDHNGDGKAAVSTPKKCTPPVRKGATTGAAIRLREAGEILGIAEGIESAEAVFEATGTPTWATCAANRLEKVLIPAGVREVQIWGDYDTSGTGQRAARKLAERLMGEGFLVKLLLPPEADKDWLDVLVEEGAEALRNALAAAPIMDPSVPVPVNREANTPTAAAFASPLVPSGDHVSILNSKHFVVTIGGRTYIATESIDPATGYQSIELGRVQDFSLRYSNWLVQVNDRKEIPATQLWLASNLRRSYEGVVFAPGKEMPGYFNLWRGFAVEPRQGDCSLFWKHVRTVICRDDLIHYQYVRGWLAHLVQKPAELPGVALVIRGGQGTGKTFFADLVGELVGQHYLTLNRMEQLVGRFTGHLKDALLVCANEAIWSGDKQGEGALKSLITDSLCTVESKGKDLYQVRNYKRLIVTTNEQWAVPMAMDDRRFLVLEASDAHRGDKRYFSAIAQQMHEEGGLQALLHDLLSDDISEFDVRTKPKSSHGFDIKLHTAEPIVRWWFEQLFTGEITWSASLINPQSWPTMPTKDALHQSFLAFCASNQMRKFDKPFFCKTLHKLFPGCPLVETKVRDGKKRVPSYKLPTLQECREAFQRYGKAGPEIWNDGSQAENEEGETT